MALEIVGKTMNGTSVVSGIGKLYFQDGLPLSVIFDNCLKLNVQPSFYHLYFELKNNGMTHDRIKHLLNEHVFESYGAKYRDEIIQRIEKLST